MLEKQANTIMSDIIAQETQGSIRKYKYKLI